MIKVPCKPNSVDPGIAAGVVIIYLAPALLTESKRSTRLYSDEGAQPARTCTP